MNNKKLLIWGIITAFFIVAVILRSNFSGVLRQNASVPSYLIQGLNPETISKIEITAKDGNNKVTLIKKGGHFVVKELHGYPAEMPSVNNLISNCLNIKTIELTTNEAKNYADLEVSEKSAVNVVRFYDSDDKFITGLAVGKSVEHGAYVRRFGAPGAYLCQITFHIRNKAIDYVNNSLLKLPADKITKVTVKPADSKKYSIVHKDGKAVMQEVPNGRKVKQNVLNEVLKSLANLTFNSVKPLSGVKYKFLEKLTCETVDKRKYIIEAAKSGQDYWIKLQAESTDQQMITIDRSKKASTAELKAKEAKLLAKDAVEKARSKAEGWIFKISSFQADNMFKKQADLLEDIKKESDKKGNNK
ncbi:MAG: DUF4340 domain-containing protein [Victivallaceae bacterium]